MTAPPTERTKVLLVEDDPTMVLFYTKYLSKIFDVDTATTAADGLTKLASGYPFQAVVLDLNLPNGSGLALIERFQTCKPGVPILVVTGFAFDAADVINKGAQDILIKDATAPQELIEALTKTIARHKVRQAFAPVDKAKAEVSESIQKQSELTDRREESLPPKG